MLSLSSIERLALDGDVSGDRDSGAGCERRGRGCRSSSVVVFPFLCRGSMSGEALLSAGRLGGGDEHVGE